MVSQFVFFMGIASVCFSGLLFTLWTLGEVTSLFHQEKILITLFSTIAQDSNPPRSLRSIAWLLTQIWFGNTSLSFNDAASFHPILGPVLLISFAAMSNTLLLTSKHLIKKSFRKTAFSIFLPLVLISLLSNTVALISTVGCL